MAAADDGTECLADGAEELFEKWLLDNGASYDKIIWPARETVGGVRGTVARDDIESGEVMLSIPLKLMMTPPLALASELSDVFEENENIFINDDRVLVLFIMNEKVKGNESFFFPYLQVFSSGPLFCCSFAHM
jgi:hypothetical protein